MNYLSITVGEFAGLRGLGVSFKRWPCGPARSDGVLAPAWVLYLGPIIVRRLVLAGYPEA